VDGIVGPRTAPRFFVFGLADAATAQAFGDAVQVQVFDRWNSLGTADARAAELLRMANWYLYHAGVPDLARTFINDNASTNLAQFDSTAWAVALTREVLEAPTLAPEDAMDLADVIYHEARHAEQYFSVARMLSGQGRNAAQISARFYIKPAVAQMALDNPIRRRTQQALVASGWYESIAGNGRGHRNNTLREADEAKIAYDEAEAIYGNALENHDQAGSVDSWTQLQEAEERFEAAQRRWEGARSQYWWLPEESDGLHVGALIRAAEIRGTATPSYSVGGSSFTAGSAAAPSSSGFDGSADQARYFPESSAATGGTSGPGYVIVPERTEYPPEYQDQDQYRR
jgi:hypothetical protein